MANILRSRIVVVKYDPTFHNIFKSVLDTNAFIYKAFPPKTEYVGPDRNDLGQYITQRP